MNQPESEVGRLKPRSRQFDLLALCQWITMAAIVLAALAGGGRESTLVYHFQKVPADDRALREWYEETAGIRDVNVQRQTKEITVKYRTSAIALPMFEDDLPPWEDLGYTGISMVRQSFRVSVFRLPMFSLIAGACVLAVLYWLRRRRDVHASPARV